MLECVLSCLLSAALTPLSAPAPVPAPVPGEQFQYVHGGVVMRVVSTGDNDLWTTHTGGVIRWSIDGGTSFTNARVPTSVTGTLRGIQISSDGQGPFAYCVGADGVLLFSTDNGHNWTLKPQVLNPFLAPAELWDCFFKDRDNGWIVGFDHTIYETSDGGLNWTNIAPLGHIAAANPEWYQIYAWGPDEWIAVADEGWYIRHLPGGSMPHARIDVTQECYQPQIASPPFDLELWSVDFVGDTGLMAGGVGNNDGYVYKSTDRGATWNLHTSCYDHLSPTGNGLTPPSFYGVEMFDDPTKGMPAGYGSGVYFTGLSSTSAAVTGCPNCPAGSLALTQVVNDSDANMTVEATDDSGKPLQRDISTSDSQLVAWTVGDFGTVRRSDDQGMTWTEKAGLHRGRIRGGEFDDLQTGTVFGQGWRIYWTTNGGQDFTLEDEPTIPLDPMGNPWFGQSNAAALTPGAAEAVVVGDRGRIAVRDNAGVWTDRSIGLWSTPTTLTAALISDDASVILVTAPSGTVYLSIDGGANFTPNTLMSGGSPVTADLTDMVLMNNYVLYLGANHTMYAANVNNLFTAVAAVPMVGSTAIPTALASAPGLQIYAGNAGGQLFKYNTGSGQLELVTAITPADLGNRVNDIEPVPGTADWFFGGESGTVQHFDGTVWKAVKSSFEREVRSLEFFSATEGLIVGRKTSIGVW